MQNKKRINVSGYRGIWGEDLNKELITLYTRAFVSFTKEKHKKPKILIGRDGRASGPEIKEIILNELKNLGVEGIDGDIMPTPTILFSVRKHKYSGAIIITASHNPIEYNGLKFVNDKALFTIKDEVAKINEYYEQELAKGYSSSKPVENKSSWKDVFAFVLNKETPNFPKEHVDHIIKNIDVETIRAKNFKVVADMINASACVMDKYLFEQLGVELIPLNDTPNGQFGHRPEPLRENLLETERVAKESSANVGFVHDPDADRLVVINEKGEVISEEYSIALAFENILSKNKGKPAVVNLSTSQRGVDVAKKYGSEVFRTKIGEGFVVDGMMEHKAIIGGEGNGGIIYPTINTCRDSFTGIALILELMAQRNKTISELVAEIPQYIIKKDKWSVEGVNLDEIYTKLKSIFKEAKIDEQDGIRFDLPDGAWIHLRPSNTEPIIRLFGEATTQERIDSLFEEAKKAIV